MSGGGDFGTTARTEPENLRSFRLKSGQPSSRADSAIWRRRPEVRSRRVTGLAGGLRDIRR